MEKIINMNGEEYVLKSSIKRIAQKKGDQYCMVRTYSAGVWCGYIDPTKTKAKYNVVKEAKRIWKWEKAASLSQLAVDGTGSPNSCRVPTPVEIVHLYDIVEVIPMTEKAIESINKIPVWKS